MPVQAIRSKYSGTGGFGRGSFKSLPIKVSSVLQKEANYSVAMNTWKNYNTATNHIDKAMKWSSVEMKFPFTGDMTLAYIAYLRGKPKPCKSETIEKYMSGLRMAHMNAGFDPPCLRQEIVKQVLNGAAQVDLERDRVEGKPERLAVTVPILQLLKQAIKCRKDWTQNKKRLVWAVTTMAFAGSFRIHELLSREMDTFDETQTLLGRDIEKMMVEIDGESVDMLVVHIKSPKEQKLSRGIKVEIFSCPGTVFCPVSAYRKWLKVSSIRVVSTAPLFRVSSGRCYTGRCFNKDLKTLLNPHIDYDQGKVLAHSFRSGLATSMAQLGYSDGEIQQIGRWTSQAYLRYVKTARTKRSRIARELAGRMESLL